MSSINKVIIIGRLGQDPEMRIFDNGDKIANLSIATSERWTDKRTGDPKETTEWHRVVLHGKVADIAEQYLRKGAQVYIEGSLHTRKWTDNNGIERYSTEIKSYTMQMLGSRSDNPQPQGNQQGYAPQQSNQQGGYPQPPVPQQGFAPQHHAYAPDPAPQQNPPRQQRPLGVHGSLYQPMPQQGGYPQAQAPQQGVPDDDMPF